MRTLVLICLMIGSGFASSLRAKREVYQFAQLIECVTDKWFGAYLGYGCWCGFGNSGTETARAVDATDRCCKDHDNCYKRLWKSRICYRWELYVQSYFAFAYNCGSRLAAISCPNTDTSDCAAQLCRCDKIAAYCFRENLSTYDANFKDDDNFTC